jgi:hypothetical protein
MIYLFLIFSYIKSSRSHRKGDTSKQLINTMRKRRHCRSASHWRHNCRQQVFHIGTSYFYGREPGMENIVCQRIWICETNDKMVRKMINKAAFRSKRASE